MTLDIIFITVILTILNTVLIISFNSNLILLNLNLCGYFVLNIMQIAHK